MEANLPWPPARAHAQGLWGCWWVPALRCHLCRCTRAVGGFRDRHDAWKWRQECWGPDPRIQQGFPCCIYISTFLWVCSATGKEQVIRRAWCSFPSLPKPQRELCCWEGARLSPGSPAAPHTAREAAPILQPVEPFTQSPSVNSICNIN